MNKSVNIVLVLKSGGDFRMSDVYLLVSHINKYWKGVIRPSIYCYTDLVTEEKQVVGLTIRRLSNPEWQGWWSKMNLFTPSLQALRPFLYLDLDTAVVNSIDAIVPPEDKQDSFITLRDFYRPKYLASGLMWIPNTKLMDDIYSVWMADCKKHMIKFRGDQNFLASVTLPNMFWQDVFGQDFITTFKPNKQWRVNLEPHNAVICFHGKPRIPEAALTVKWVKEYVGYEI